LFSGRHGGRDSGYHDIRREQRQLACERREAVKLPFGPSQVEHKVATFNVPELAEPLSKPGHKSTMRVLSAGNQTADAPHALALLRPRRERPSNPCAPSVAKNFRRSM
jgi:hypothetical protein